MQDRKSPSQRVKENDDRKLNGRAGAPGCLASVSAGPLCGVSKGRASDPGWIPVRDKARKQT